MAIWREANSINGRLCKCFATIDGKVEELFFAQQFNADIEKTKEEKAAMGDLWMHHKASGFSGSGSMTIRYVTPVFRAMLKRYEVTKEDEYFNLTVVNNDPGSKAGIQSVLLLDCNIDGSVAGKFDVDSGVLDEEINFTFEGVDYLSTFNNPSDYSV